MQRGITPKTQVYQSNCNYDLYAFKQDKTVYCQSAAGMATDLTINYASFAPFFFFTIFFSFSLTWDHIGEWNSFDISSDGNHQIHSQKIMHTHRKGLYQSRSKNCEISDFGILPFFFLFSFSVTWDHIGVKVSNDISCERTHQICSPNSCIPLERDSTKVVKRILKFWIFGVVFCFCFCFCFFFSRFTW